MGVRRAHLSCLDIGGRHVLDSVDTKPVRYQPRPVRPRSPASALRSARHPSPVADGDRRRVDHVGAYLVPTDPARLASRQRLRPGSGRLVNDHSYRLVGIALPRSLVSTPLYSFSSCV